MLGALLVVGIFAAVTSIVTIVSLMALVLHFGASAPECTQCNATSELVWEDVYDVGNGWLKSERNYVCPRCRTASRREYVLGPLDCLGSL